MFSWASAQTFRSQRREEQRKKKKNSSGLFLECRTRRQLVATVRACCLFFLPTSLPLMVILQNLRSLSYLRTRFLFRFASLATANLQRISKLWQGIKAIRKINKEAIWSPWSPPRLPDSQSHVLSLCCGVSQREPHCSLPLAGLICKHPAEPLKPESCGPEGFKEGRRQGISDNLSAELIRICVEIPLVNH